MNLKPYGETGLEHRGGLAETTESESGNQSSDPGATVHRDAGVPPGSIEGRGLCARLPTLRRALGTRPVSGRREAKEIIERAGEPNRRRLSLDQSQELFGQPREAGAIVSPARIVKSTRERASLFGRRQIAAAQRPLSIDLAPLLSRQPCPSCAHRLRVALLALLRRDVLNVSSLDPPAFGGVGNPRKRSVVRRRVFLKPLRREPA